MTFAAVTLLGMTVGQPLAPDYYPMNSRTIRLPIEYKKDRKAIRQVMLYVARNGENTWYQEAFVTPDKDAFVYVAKDDGVYWFKMVIEDLKGNKDPADLTRDPPDLKMVIDTVAPQVRVTNAKRTGEEIVVEWSVEDKFPNDAETKVHFRATDNPKTYWQEVTLPANSRTGVKFPTGTTDGVTVKITAVDVAGNRTEITKDIPAVGDHGRPLADRAGNAQRTVRHRRRGAIAPPAPMDLTPPAGGPLAPAMPTGPAPVAPITPPGGPGPAAPLVAVPPSPVPPAPPVQPYVPPVPAYNAGPAPLATMDPKAAPPAGPLPAQGAAPAGAGPGPRPRWNSPARRSSTTRGSTSASTWRTGPSGISRVDLWVTRDDGKSWPKWSQHDGKGGSVRVALDVRENTQLEGTYGFRLVPVSGAGLSEREPVAGDAPDMRVILDVTPPADRPVPARCPTRTPRTRSSSSGRRPTATSATTRSRWSGATRRPARGSRSRRPGTTRWFRRRRSAPRSRSGWRTPGSTRGGCRPASPPACT